MKNKNILLPIVVAVYFFAIQIAWGFITFYLIDINMSAYIADFWKYSSIVALISLPCFGFIIDKFKNKSIPIMFGLFIAALFPMVLSKINSFETIIFASAFFGIFISTFYWIIEGFIENAAISHDMDYAKIRPYGSLAFGISALTSGYLITGFTLNNFVFTGMGYINFYYLLTPLFIIAGVLLLFFSKTKGTIYKPIKFNDVKHIVKIKEYIFIFIYVLIVWGVYSLVTKVYEPQQFYIVIGEPDLATQMLGIKASISTLIEVVTFIIAAKLINKNNAILGLTISGIAMIARLLVLGYMPENISIFILFESMHGIAFPFLLISLFKVLEKIIPMNTFNTAYALTLPFAGELIVALFTTPVNNYVTVNQIAFAQIFYVAAFIIFVALIVLNTYGKKII